MSPITIAKYLVISAMIVLPSLFGLYLLFVGSESREEKRNRIKHRFYLSRNQFKVISRLGGLLLLALGITTAVLFFLSHQD